MCQFKTGNSDKISLFFVKILECSGEICWTTSDSVSANLKTKISDTIPRMPFFPRIRDFYNGLAGL